MQRARFSLVTALAVAAITVSACGGQDGPGGVPSFSVTAERVADGIRLSNGDSHTLAYRATQYSTSVQIAIKHGPCDDCRLAPNESTVIPLDAIHGYTAETQQAIVYLWRVVPDGDGLALLEELEPVIVDL